MVHFKDYTTPSSNNKYLLIEADDDTILSKLLTHTLLVSRCANPWTPLVNSLHMPNWTSEHNLGSNRSVKVWTLQTLNQHQLNIASTLPCLGHRILQGDIHWGSTIEIDGEFHHIQGYWEWAEDILARNPVRKEKISAHLKSTHNPTGTIPNAEKWSSTDDATFSKLGVGVKGPSPAETQKEEPPALTQLLSINDHTKTRAIVVMDIVIGRSQTMFKFWKILTKVSRKIAAKSYFKAKKHLEHVLRERYEKSKEVSAACKSLEKARKKVKKLKARLDTAKREAAEMESKVSTAEEEFSKCSDVSLATTTASKVVEKKKKVLEATLQDFINYKLYYD
ncbi:hypothetical protein FXO37_03310 [Capsicum annuum]|nr:hypothetical protein FXO37_03310 [Capsicum annuum]